MASKTHTALDFADFGNDKERRYGVQSAFDEKAKVLWLRIPMSAEAIKGAPLSSSGKSKLVGNSSGFAMVEGAPNGVRCNVTVTASVK
jgi:hypothetical protein